MFCRLVGGVGFQLPNTSTSHQDLTRFPWIPKDGCFWCPDLCGDPDTDLCFRRSRAGNRGEQLLLRRLVERVGSRGVVGHVDDLDDLGGRLLDGDLNALAEGDGGHRAARAAAT